MYDPVSFILKNIKSKVLFSSTVFSRFRTNVALEWRKSQILICLKYWRSGQDQMLKVPNDCCIIHNTDHKHNIEWNLLVHIDL